MQIRKATYKDLSAILILQKEAFLQEAEIYNDYTIQPLKETQQEIENDFSKENKYFFIIEKNEQIIAAVRAEIDNNLCSVQKLIVKPEFQNKGLGKLLMNTIEDNFRNIKKFILFTGEKSEKNISFYTKLGYQIVRKGKYLDNIHKVFMEKSIEAESRKSEESFL